MTSADGHCGNNNKNENGSDDDDDSDIDQRDERMDTEDENGKNNRVTQVANESSVGLMRARQRNLIHSCRGCSLNAISQSLIMLSSSNISNNLYDVVKKLTCSTQPNFPSQPTLNKNGKRMTGVYAVTCRNGGDSFRRCI